MNNNELLRRQILAVLGEIDNEDYLKRILSIVDYHVKRESSRKKREEAKQ